MNPFPHGLASVAAASTLAALLTLTGCATGPAGQQRASPPPPGTPSARLTLRAAISPQDQAAIQRLNDQAACGQPELLARVTGGPAGQNQGDTTMVAAGRPMTLQFVIPRSGAASCFVRWTFTPQPDRHYVVSGIAIGGGCNASLTDTVAGRGTLPPDLLERTAPGQACVPLDRARRPAASQLPLNGGQVDGEAVLLPQATANDLQGLIRP